QIESAEQSKAARRRPDNLTAYEVALRASAHIWEGQSKADQSLVEQSIREAKEALALDPNSVLALHALALASGFSLFLRLAPDRELALQEARNAAARAIELDPADPFGYALRAFGIFLGGQLERYPDALSEARFAHEMNPSDTFVLWVLAH